MATMSDHKTLGYFDSPTEEEKLVVGTTSGPSFATPTSEKNLTENTVHTTIYSMTANLVRLDAISIEQAVKIEKSSKVNLELRVSLLRALGVIVWFPDLVIGGITEKTNVILKFKSPSDKSHKLTKQGVKSIW